MIIQVHNKYIDDKEVKLGIAISSTKIILIERKVDEQ